MPSPISRVVYVLTLLWVLPVPILAGQSPERIFVFGNSLSDTGNIASIQGPLPDPPYFEGRRITNGPVYAEVLADELGIALEPSLHLVGPATGTNYAVTGASANGTELIDLPFQVTLFLANMGGTAPRDALYLILIGGNDVRSARDEPDRFQAWRIVNRAVLAQIGAIRALAHAGAKKFLILTVPDIGGIPETRLLAATTGDSALIDKATRLSRWHNALLAYRLARLEHRLELAVTEYDVFEQLNEILAYPEQYGFENTTEPCFSSATQTFNPSCDFETFVFFDEIHPSARVHALVGEDLVELVRQALPAVAVEP